MVFILSERETELGHRFMLEKMKKKISHNVSHNVIEVNNVCNGKKNRF